MTRARGQSATQPHVPTQLQALTQSKARTLQMQRRTRRKRGSKVVGGLAITSSCHGRRHPDVIGGGGGGGGGVCGDACDACDHCCCCFRCCCCCCYHYHYHCCSPTWWSSRSSCSPWSSALSDRTCDTRPCLPHQHSCPAPPVPCSASPGSPRTKHAPLSSRHRRRLRMGRSRLSWTTRRLCAARRCC